MSKTIRQIQEESFEALSPNLLWNAKSRYLRAVDLVGKSTELAHKIRDKKEFYLTTFWEPYLLLAQYYVESEYNEGQLSLFNNNLDHDQYFRDQWSKFFIDESLALAQDDTILRAILLAVVYEHTEKGHKALNVLLEAIRMRYGHFDGDLREVNTNQIED